MGKIDFYALCRFSWLDFELTKTLLSAAWVGQWLHSMSSLARVSEAVRQIQCLIDFFPWVFSIFSVHTKSFSVYSYKSFKTQCVVDYATK